ncbi:hypothetical protein [Flavobacterium ginsenosidimutans]|uniref:Lipoprotein n=1 Tax=Flavobacterium ginsenosidimutans TaxID=687844 RepID=A0ABZ2Q5X2_9FLAO|nr:hypothetical protein [Flavobacterium ginsenosidimutans]KAF2328782.1 hypothetical protein DM444_17090 [Flavobacterium ginsenosidimutans]
MKKLILFIAFALIFTIFSCTPDEYETQPVKKIEKVKKPLQAGDPNPDGPGDKGSTPPPIKP